jgi:hypothetical protein
VTAKANFQAPLQPMAQREAAVWKFRVNKKADNQDAPTRRFHTSARITNEQGLAEAEANQTKTHPADSRPLLNRQHNVVVSMNPSQILSEL